MPYISVALGPDLSGRLAFVRLFDRDPTDPEALAWNDVTQAWQVAGSIYSQEAILLTETPPGSGTYELAADPGSGSLDTHYQVSVAPVGAVDPDPSDPVVWDGVPPALAATARTAALSWGLPTPAAQDIRLAAGDDVTLAFAALAGTDPAGVGAAVAFACRHPLTGLAVLTAAATALDPDAGTFEVTVAAADTALLDPLLTYRWDATRTDPGAVARLAHGRLLVAASQR